MTIFIYIIYGISHNLDLAVTKTTQELRILFCRCAGSILWPILTPEPTLSCKLSGAQVRSMELLYGF